MPVTLLTDFGTSDYFVAAMKGEILARAPGVPIVDITHEVPPQDVESAAFTLLAAYPSFAPPAVHVAVVDPGVGSDRRPIVVDAGGHRFVGPDNGLFSHVLEREDVVRIYHVTEARFFRAPVSTTFHGRDVFAPVGGALAAGVDPRQLGAEIVDPVRLEPLRAARGADGSVRARVIHIDRFGNCVTSVRRDDLVRGIPERGLRVGPHRVDRVQSHFAEAGGRAGEAFAIWGSAGFLEIAVDRGSAADLLGIRRGDPVVVDAADRPSGDSP